MDRRWVYVCKEGSEIISYIFGRKWFFGLFFFPPPKRDWYGRVNSDLPTVNNTLME